MHAYLTSMAVGLIGDCPSLCPKTYRSLSRHPPQPNAVQTFYAAFSTPSEDAMCLLLIERRCQTSPQDVVILYLEVLLGAL